MPRHRATASRAGYRRHTQPQSTGAPPTRHCAVQGPATSRKQDNKQISPPSQTKGSSPPSQTSATPTALAAAKCAVQLCVSVLQNNCTAGQWARGAVVLKANSAAQHLRRVGHVRAGSMEARRIHKKQRRQLQCARAGETKQPQGRSPPPSSRGRAAVAAPTPRAVESRFGGGTAT